MAQRSRAGPASAEYSKGLRPSSAEKPPRLTRQKASPYLGSSARTHSTRAPAQVAELVDALVSGTSAPRRGGSSPLLGTKHFSSFSRLVILSGLRRLALGCRPPIFEHK